ncbi:MAG: NAD(P)H-dependent oxidoreductase subunit E [Oscillospiraceae bacterium]|jgi:NADH-quinone oxidoreductase subunit E|nr:NAD(P)H-dependent oxidoreductase subunit E [Oscillospiraceae bacterium]
MEKNLLRRGDGEGFTGMGCNCAESALSVDTALLEPYLAEYGGAEGGLISLLQKAQELYGWLPADLLINIARRIGVKPAKIMGVVTFYTQFRTKPAGKHLILLCQGTACHVNGSAGIEEAVREYLGVDEGEMTENGLFTYNNVACLGCCSLSPVMMSGGKTYGGLTKDSAVRILKEIERGEAV